MNIDTINSNTEANLNYCQAADDIIEIFEQQGFTSDCEPDVELLRHLIVSAIQNRIEGDNSHEQTTLS
jgi:hypothetical protein